MLKRFFISVAFVSLFVASGGFLYAQSEDESEDKGNLPEFQLLLFGNRGYANNSDLKDFSSKRGEYVANEVNEYEESKDGLGGFKVDGTSSANSNVGGGLEIRIFPNLFGFGLETEFSMAESVSKISSSDYTQKYEYSTNLFVFSLCANLYYQMPVNEFSFFTFGAGFGKYFAVVESVLSSNNEIPMYIDVFEPITDVTSTTGFKVKAEYTIHLRPVCLTAGIMGRYVEFDGFTDENIKLNLKAGLTGVSLYLAAGLSI